MTTDYRAVTEHLRNAYATSATQRDQMVKYPWKLDERESFRARLESAGAKQLLEIGAGSGQDSAFFAENGFEVVATDLTPEMVELCRAKGLDARVMDAMHLDLADESFDAVWTINTLLHVPDADLPAVLEEIARVLRPGALLFLGVYGGEKVGEGIFDDDAHEPKRFFSFRSAGQLEAFVTATFDVVDLHVVDLDRGGRPGGFTFQSVTARRP